MERKCCGGGSGVVKVPKIGVSKNAAGWIIDRYCLVVRCHAKDVFLH